VHRLSTADCRVDSLIAGLHERGELVDREVVLHPVAELFGNETRVVGERLRRFGRLPTAVLVLQRLRKIPVVQRHERLDAGGEELVDEPVVEVETLRVRLPGAFGKIRGQATENRYASAPIDFISATSSSYRW
jgi:hypothetical protein